MKTWRPWKSATKACKCRPITRCRVGACRPGLGHCGIVEVIQETTFNEMQRLYPNLPIYYIFFHCSRLYCLSRTDFSGKQWKTQSRRISGWNIVTQPAWKCRLTHQLSSSCMSKGETLSTATARDILHVIAFFMPCHIFNPRHFPILVQALQQLRSDLQRTIAEASGL